MTVLNDAARRLLDGRNFATVATVNADGSPQTSVVWVKRDGDAIEFSAVSSRRKVRNVAADPRVSVCVFDLENPYHYVELRGSAELIDDPEKSLSRELSRKYLDEEPPPEPEAVKRVIVRVTPRKLVEFSA